ncbi:MAG: glycoside hydrolase family 2 protein, partial [Clostridia bacterium]
PRPEHPRPHFLRAEWASLNGVWEFAFDPEEVGCGQHWERRAVLDSAIVVPFPVESRLSGIGDRTVHDVVWYARTVTVPRAWRDRAVLLHFGAVDWRADVYLNGCHAASHKGGQTPFEVDTSPYVDADGVLRIVVRAEDRARDRGQPRGKQYWKDESERIFYTRTTGIWQSVYWEPVQETHITRFHLRPQRGDGSVGFEAGIAAPADGTVLEIRIADADGLYAEARIDVDGRELEGQAAPLNGTGPHPWSPDDPHLYDVTLTLRRGSEILDQVQSYLGFRDLIARDGRLYLNGAPYFLKMVLDQGYWPDGILTAPSDAALLADVRLMKAMGFNGVRKHQKVEDPRFLYHCDREGLIAFGEMANAFSFSPTSASRLAREWMEVVERDRSHPAVLAWVPLNESWGVPDLARDPRQQAHLQSLYHLTKSLDPDRLVISNDGWEHATSDCLTIHDYEGDPDILRARYQTLADVMAVRPAGRPLYAPGHDYDGAPVLVSEMGGVASGREGGGGWGYTRVGSSADLLERYRAMVTAVADSPVVNGFCWTQLADVEQEQNGLVTEDREPKVDVQALFAVNAALRPRVHDFGTS